MESKPTVTVVSDDTRASFTEAFISADGKKTTIAPGQSLRELKKRHGSLRFKETFPRASGTVEVEFDLRHLEASGLDTRVVIGVETSFTLEEAKRLGLKDPDFL